MSADLKRRTIKGMLWSATEGFSVQGLQFLMGIILARLLSPHDYGLVGMLAIFIAISQTIIDSGFSSALIQKKNRNEADYSTVFYFNCAIGLFLYLILWIAAPGISRFYNEPQLLILTKVIGINVVITSLAIVQRAKLTITLDFKTQAKASLLSVIAGGCVGISLAYRGFGVWALVFQTITRNFLNTLLLWIFARWTPHVGFSKKSFSSLFSFGSRLLGAGLLDTVYRNIYLLIIGKVFTTQELGFYTRADQFKRLPSQNATAILQRVTFPVLSSIQDDEKQLLHAVRRFIRFAAFIIFPLMMGMFAVARPMILVLLTDKWAPVVPLLQLLCFAGMLYPIHAININVLNVRGRSDLFLRLEIIKKILITVSIIAALPFGITALVIGQIITSVISFFINTYYTEKVAHYGPWKQIKDILPFFILAAIMSGTILLLQPYLPNNILRLSVGIFIGIIIYFGGAMLLRFPELQEIKHLLKR